MGRRAADLTAPVPVLGVPALVGLRGWRTIAADRTGGALQPSWGPQYSIGIPTSPVVGRPPANYNMQLTGTLPAPSDGIQMSNNFINHNSEYKEILKSDKEKGAILKLKTRSSKTKKEVTFQTAECEASKDVTCSLESSQTCCHAKEIKGNLHLSDNAGAKSKLKPVRYSNGSVVDSEAIGGISIDEAEPATSSIGKKHTKLPSHQAEKSGNPLLFSGARPVRTPQQICGHCGGRQLDAAGITPLDQKSTCLGEKGIIPLLTAGHFTMTETSLDHKLNQSPFKISDERIPVSPQLYLREEFMHRKIGPPPCPLHSRSNLTIASNALFTQPSNFVSAKTVNVTKATVETQPPHHDIISQATRLHLTPQMATATKSNVPHSHTYPQNRGVLQHNLTCHNVPLSVCVSVHAAPDSTPPSLYTTATGEGTISITNAHRRTTECNAALKSTENVAAANAKYETSVDGSKSKCTQMTINCHTVSLAPSTEAVHKLETSTQTAAVSQSSIPPSSGHQLQQRPSLSAAMDSSRLPAISSAPCSAAPLIPLSLAHQRTLKQNSDKMTQYSIKPATSQCRSVQSKYTNTETTLRVYAADPNAALNSPNNQTSITPLSGMAPNSTSMCRKAQTIALRNSSTYLKTSPPTPPVSSSPLTEYQMDACVSAAVSLQSADKTQHNRELAGNNTNQLGKGSRAQLRDESSLGCVASASATCPAAVSELAKYHQRDTDASYSQSDISPRNDSLSGGNKVNSNPIRKLVTESKHHENSIVSQATSLQNYISLIKPSGPRLHACMSTEQHCEGYAEHVGQHAACPPVNTDQKTKKVEKFAARREDAKLDFSADKGTHNPTASVSSLVNPDGDANSVSESLIQLTSGLDTSSSARANKGPELSSTLTPPLNNSDNRYSGPICSPILPSSTMSLASSPHMQSIVRPDSKSSPSGPRPCLGDTGGAHSHPADVARLLPPSPQCCKSASLQQKLESVEASLAANKDRITTLLNIIHDLETSHTPSSG